jgi:CubicO group peptidase (beta-lactamase class C family)
MPASCLVLFCIIGLAACGEEGEQQRSPQGPRAFVYPGSEWAVESPEAHDLDSTLLEDAAALAEESVSNCLVVVRDGVIVGEWYWNGWGPEKEQNVFSVTKSFTSALVGIAQDRGELDITEEACDYIPEWVDTASDEVTIRNLISNDSGRHWDFITDYVRNYALSEDRTAHAIGLGQQYEPGTEWKYNNSAIQTLEVVLSEATGMDVADYADRYLFEPLGMASSYGRDRAGNPVTYADLSASCRDLARFGYLYLRGGRWEDDLQVVSEAWVEESTRPSTPLNSSYGYMWWLNYEGLWVAPSVPDHETGYGKPMRNLPENVYQANGAFNQIILVDPNADIVFTRIGWARSIEDIASNVLTEGLAERIRAARLD